MSKQYVLTIGCHRNTIASRDSGNRYFDTYDEAVESYTRSKSTWQRIGYVVWFATVTDTVNGEITQLESNIVMRR